MMPPRSTGGRAYAKGGAGGAIAANAAVATTSDSGNVKVLLANGAKLDAGNGALSIGHGPTRMPPLRRWG